MSCPACGLDYCDGSCPPNQPLVYENCAVCGNREEYDDLTEDLICYDCDAKGYSRFTMECHSCGTCITDNGTPPFKTVEVRGLLMSLCTECEATLTKEQMT